MFAPDLVILDWEMPVLNGAELGASSLAWRVPVPDVRSSCSRNVERWRVIEASRLGVNEFLRKPVSGKSLLDRIVAILTHRARMVRLGDYYGPEPRAVLRADAEDGRHPRPCPRRPNLVRPNDGLSCRRRLCAASFPAGANMI